MSDNGNVHAIHSLIKKANDLACENDTLVNRVKVLEEALWEITMMSSSAKFGALNPAAKSDLLREINRKTYQALEADNG